MTANGAIYYVYFDPSQYDSFLDTYLHLLTWGFGFGFYRTYNGSGVWSHDPKIGNTISQIVSDFLYERGNKTVLLYHCDFDDGKQKGRDKIFNDWYEAHVDKDRIYKHRVRIDTLSGEKIVRYYMGYLTVANNPNMDKVRSEFESLAESLTEKF